MTVYKNAVQTFARSELLGLGRLDQGGVPYMVRYLLDVNSEESIEDEEVTISRAKTRLTFPANFMLVGAMNPCTCAM